MNNIHSIKITTLGNSGIGKTRFLKKYCGAVYNNDFPTIGVDFCSKIINNYNIQYHIKFWDCAGDKRFLSIIRPYYRDTEYFIIFFDAENINYKDNINLWLNEIKYEIYKDNYSLLLVGLSNNSYYSHYN